MNKTHAFNLMLSPRELSDLQFLSDTHGLSKAAILRQSLASRIAMEIHAQPTCATGRPCFVAHLHPSQALNAASPPNQPEPTHDQAPHQPSQMASSPDRLPKM